MKRARLRQIFALMLGFVVALGMSASAIQATDMAVKMTLASHIGAMDNPACDGCGDGQGMKATSCGVVCVAPVVAALPQAVTVMRVDARELPIPIQPRLVGWTSSPDPRPPRSTDLG